MSRSRNTAWHRKPPPNWTFWQFRRGTGRYLRRQWEKAQRQQARAALAEMEVPQPARPRHSAHYGYW